MRKHASSCPMDTAGVSQDELRDMADGFVPEELVHAVDVNGMMRNYMLLCWYEVDKCGIGMSSLLEWSLDARGAPCIAAMGPPMMRLTHSSVDMGCSDMSGLRSGDQPAELLGEILC